MKKIIGIWNNYKELIMYLVFGGVSFVLNIVLYVFLTQFCSFYELIANILSWFVVIIFVFYTNRKWVFEAARQNNLKQFLEFVYSRILTLIMEEIILFTGIEIFSIKDIYVKIFGQIMVIIVNYILSKCIVFKKNK